MNTSVVSVVLAASMLPLAWVSAAHAGAAADRKAIAAVYACQNQAFRRRDAAAVAATMDPKFVGYAYHKPPENKSEGIALLKYVFAMMGPGSTETQTIKSISFRPGAAVALIRVSALLVITGPDKKLHKMRIASNARDLWVKTRAGWQIKESRQLSGVQESLDGRSIKPPRTTGG